MEIVFAAIGGPEVGSTDLAEAIGSLARRSSLEEVPVPSEGPFAIRFRQPWDGESSAWCDVELRGADALTTLLETTRAIAAHVDRPVRAVASGVERALGAGRVEIGYRAYEVLPDGASRDLCFAEADEACGEVHDDRPKEELGSIHAVLVGDAARDASAATLADPGRAFRRRPHLTDPRLARLAATILAAKAVCTTPDPSGRIRLRIDARDGGKQISFVSTDEAATLQRATNRF